MNVEEDQDVLQLTGCLQTQPDDMMRLTLNYPQHRSFLFHFLFFSYRHIPVLCCNECYSDLYHDLWRYLSV